MGQPTDLGITLDQVRQGLAHYPADHQHELLWLHSHAIAEHLTPADVAQLVGADWPDITRCWQGTAPAAPANLIAAIRLVRANLAHATLAHFVHTEVTEHIIQACDLALDWGACVQVCGPSGRGKSLTVKTWAQQHPGQVTYIDVPVPTNLRELAAEIATQLGCRTTTKSARDIVAYLRRTLRRGDVLVLDETARLLGERPQMKMLEFLRRLHDRQGLGLVFVTTDWAKHAMEHGALANYLEQLVGRFEDTVLIPPRVLETEARAIVTAFRAPPPADLVAAILAQANRQPGALRTVFRLLRRAAQLATLKHEPLSLAHWRAAVQHRDNQHRWSPQ